MRFVYFAVKDGHLPTDCSNLDEPERTHPRHVYDSTVVMLRLTSFVRPMRATVVSRCRNLHSVVNVLFSDNEVLTRAAFLLSDLGFESSTTTYCTSVRMQHHGLNIDLHENGSIKQLRSLINSKKNYAKVMTLDLYPGLVNPPLSDTLSSTGIIETVQYALLDVEKAQQDVTVNSHPNCNETAPRFSSKGQGEGTLGVISPKELVIPTLSTKGFDNTAKVLSKFADVDVVPLAANKPGLYSSSSPEDKLLLRLFPCRTLGIVLRVESLDVAEDFLFSKGIRFERLGNAISGRELQVVDPSLSLAIDIRLSESEESNIFWREGATGVVDDQTTASMQNARVFAGEDAGKTAPSAAIDPRTLNGDCWMEVRAQAKAKMAIQGGNDGDAVKQKLKE